MSIDFYTYSGKGGRPVNEDSVVTGEGYFVVSDGLGGHDNGDNFTAICGMIHAPDSISRTIDADGAYPSTAEIPVISGIGDMPKTPFGNKLIVICCAVAAAAAIGVIAAVLTMGNKEGGESSPDSSFSERQPNSTSTTSSSSESRPFFPGLPEPPGTSDESGTSDEPGAPNVPILPEIPEIPTNPFPVTPEPTEDSL